ncbi:MAG: GntR family transcriptional regulator, partial [Verrucomicrobiales bacterium]
MEIPNSPQLKFKRIEAEIREMIKELPVGAKLPSERKFAELQQCNFLTVRRALKSLVDEGLIVRQVGSGTFVAERDGRRPVEVVAERVGAILYQDGNEYSYQQI